MEWEVSQILRMTKDGEFWLPHFQRGGVWTPEMGERLLDSLYLATPCGSIVTWCPDDGEDYGVPITDGTVDGPRTYLVDGQQRVRALHSLAPAFGDREEVADHEGRVTWVFLPNTPEFRHVAGFAEFRGRREGIFFRDIDVSERTTGVRNRAARGGGGASVRAADLQAFADGQGAHGAFDKIAELAKRVPDIEAVLLDVAHRAGAMRHRKLFVSPLGKADFQTALDIYVRINSSGMAVDAAERALAALAGAAPTSTPDGLRKVLHALHPPAEHVSTPGLSRATEERDLELQRKREEQLGFRFGLRLVAHALADEEDSGASLTRWLSYESFHQEKDRLRHAETMRSKWKLGCGLLETWDRCEAAAGALRAAIQEELRCDDYARMPRGSAARLQPVVQLLVRFPDVCQRAAADPGDSRKQVASLVLRRMLGQSGTTRQERELTDAMRQAGSWPDGVTAFRSRSSGGKLSDWLSDFLEEDATTQARPAQLLYWLLRRNEAKDFDYAKNNLPLLLGEGIRALDHRARPQCQHMLPVSLVAELLRPDGSARGAGPVSRLGNLTWISERLNGLDGLDGLGAQVVRLDLEGDRNRDAHVYDEESVSAFRKVQELAERTSPKFVNAYTRFCARREKEIARRFDGWLTELEAAKGLPSANDVPASRVIPTRDLCEFEQLLERRAEANDSGRADWTLLLCFAVDVLRPAILSHKHTLHLQRGEYFIRRPEGRSSPSNAVLRLRLVDADPVLSAGSQVDGARFEQLLRFSPDRGDGVVRVADLVSRPTEAIQILRSLFQQLGD